MRITRVVLLSALIAAGCEVKNADVPAPSPSPSSAPSSISGKDGSANNDAPVAGMIKGKPFTPERVILEGRNKLRFRLGKDFTADTELYFNLPGEGGDKLEGKEWRFSGEREAPIVHISVRSSDALSPEQSFVFGSDHTMTLRITKVTSDNIEGYIDFRASKLANTHIAGTFKGDREKWPGEPLDPSDAPYVQGKIHLTGDWKKESLGAGFAGQGADGKPHSNSAGTTFERVGGGWVISTTFKPQLTSVFYMMAAEIGYWHTRIPPGDYLVYIMRDGVPAAWKTVTVKPSDRLSVDLTVDLTNAGSLFVTVPDDEANDPNEARLELYPEGAEVPGGGRPLTLGAAEVKKGQKIVTAKNVPAGKYLVVRGKSEGAVEVIKGKEATVTLVRKAPNG
jgi:hypothetical protein